jgi:hypothetical protein
MSRKKIIGAGVGYALAGPGGALVGASLAGTDAYERGYDMSGIPFGLHVEAEHRDDETGRHWVVRFLSEVPAKAHAMLRLLDDAGQAVPGRPPFVDEAGGFVASAPIRERQCELYVPFEAMRYASPKHISLEVSLWTERGEGVAPAGRAVLDADLPPPPE